MHFFGTCSRVSVIAMCLCMISGGGGYLLCYQNIRGQVLHWIMLSTTIRSLYGLNGVVVIATSAAISHGYEGRILQIKQDNSLAGE